METTAYTPSEVDHFLRHQMPQLLAQLTPEHPAAWGSMGPQHMVEHLAAAVRLSNGRFHVPTVQGPHEQRRLWLLTDAPFAPNSRNPVLPPEPLSLRLPSLADARQALDAEMVEFYRYFARQPDATPVHMAFGELSFWQWQWFHFKHFGHHLLQFGLLPASLFPRLVA